jgi:hypothetical protein
MEARSPDFGKTGIICLFLIPLFSCVSAEKRESLPYSAPSTQARRIIEILDYQDRADGAELAEWAPPYINGGAAALEKLNEFNRYYVFVAEQSSTNRDTLLQWADNFSVEQDFPQLVFLRAYRRLTGSLSINPDELYGSFFETLMKRIAALKWPFARRYAETWILAHRLPSDIPAASPDSGEPEQVSDSPLCIYMILNVIEKTEVQSALNLVMDDILTDKTFTRDQIQAINALKSNFFDGF